MASTEVPVSKLSSAQEVAEDLDCTAGCGEFPPDTARLTVRTLRHLAEGRPLSEAELSELAADLDGREEAVAAVAMMSERNAEGEIVGHMGLTQADHPHRFEVDGRELHAWCAWDTLFLPQLLGKTARVTSQDPATGSTVTLTVTPDGVESVEDGVIVSVVFPRVEDGEAMGAEQLQEIFCSFVHFFTDLEAAARWFEQREMPVSFLTPAEAFELGSIRFASIIEQVGEA